MNEPTYSNLDTGKTYDIKVFEDSPGTIGKVLEKEKSKKDKVGSVLIEFKRANTFINKQGIEVKCSPTYTVWVMGDYPIASYRELDSALNLPYAKDEHVLAKEEHE